MTDLPVAAQSWRDDALCAQIDPELWFPEKGGPTTEPKRLCRLCPVIAECLQFALDTDQRFGIWGGQSTIQRQVLLGKRRNHTANRNTPTDPPPIRHGSQYGFKQHSQRGIPACKPCLHAVAAAKAKLREARKAAAA